MTQITVNSAVLEDILEALSSARDYLTAVDTTAHIQYLTGQVTPSPLTNLVDEQTEILSFILNPEGNTG